MHVLRFIWIIVDLHPQTAFSVCKYVIVLSCPFMVFEFPQLHVILMCLEENSSVCLSCSLIIFHGFLQASTERTCLHKFLTLAILHPNMRFVLA